VTRVLGSLSSKNPWHRTSAPFHQRLRVSLQRNSTSNRTRGGWKKTLPSKERASKGVSLHQVRLGVEGEEVHMGTAVKARLGEGLKQEGKRGPMGAGQPWTAAPRTERYRRWPTHPARRRAIAGAPLWTSARPGRR